MRANGIPTRKLRRRRRINELESKAVFMQRVYEDQIGGFQQAIKLPTDSDNMEVVLRHVAAQSQLPGLR